MTLAKISSQTAQNCKGARFDDPCKICKRINKSGAISLDPNQRNAMNTLFENTEVRRKTLRPYQEKAINLVRLSFGKGFTRTVLQLPTGGGKTLISANIIERALSRGNEVLFTVPYLPLIDQTIEAFQAEGIDSIGAMQGNHPMSNSLAKVQIATVQTLRNRQFPPSSLVIVDEAHRRDKALEKIMDEKPDVHWLGLTATPWSQGMGKVWQDLQIATTIGELIEQGYLCKFRAFSISKPDLSGARVKAGEFVEADIETIMSEKKIVGDVVENWLANGENRPTFVFCVNRAHAAKVHERFTNAGISSAYVDGNSDRVERQRIEGRFRSGEVRVVCSVRTLCLDAETEILTREGWAGIDDISPSHNVASWHPTGDVTFEPALQIFEREKQPGERMVSLSTNTANFRVTEGHELAMFRGRDGAKFVDKRAARELVERRFTFPVSGDAVPDKIEIDNTQTANEKRLRINSLAYKYRSQGFPSDRARLMATEFNSSRYNQRAAKNPSELSLDDCRFIGFWCGDGTNSGGRYAISQSEANMPIIDWLEVLFARCGFHYTVSNYAPSTAGARPSRRFCFSTGLGGRGQKVEGGLYPVLPYLDKDGSDLLWGLDERQFSAFLEGYWMADGNHGKDGTGHSRGRVLYIKSRKMVDKLQAIGACRGYRMGWRKTHIYHLSFSKPQCGASQAKTVFDDGVDGERVWCVKSQSGYIITRRKGKVLVMGNCTGVDWPVSCVIDAAPTQSEILHIQKWGRGLRVNPPYDDCLFFDHAGNSLRLGLPTQIHHDTLDMGEKREAKRKNDGEEKTKDCPHCATLVPKGVMNCPTCGHEFKPPPPRDVDTVEGSLVELTNAPKKPTREDKQAFWSMALYLDGQREKGGRLAKGLYKAKWGVWPKGLEDTTKVPTPEFMNYERSRRIAYAKKMEKERAKASA